jgi:hypothetical protein
MGLRRNYRETGNVEVATTAGSLSDVAVSVTVADGDAFDARRSRTGMD